jgi:hypothetical protein
VSATHSTRILPNHVTPKPILKRLRLTHWKSRGVMCFHL